MNEFITVFNQIFVLLLLSIIGYYCRKKRMFKDDFAKSLSSFLVNVSLPALIISAFPDNYDKELIHKMIEMSIISVFYYIISFVIAYISTFLIKVKNEDSGVYRFITIFSNVGFIGYPVVESIFGKSALFYTAIFNIPFNILVFTIGIIIISSGSESKFDYRKLINPGIIAVLIGFFKFFSPIDFPEVINKTVDIIGGTTTPMSMIVIGAILADLDIKTIFSNFILYIFSAIRLILIPIIMFIVLSYFKVDRLLSGIAIIISAMPAAANTVILAEEYGGNGKLASEAIFITTLFSIITIPLISIFVK